MRMLSDDLGQSMVELALLLPVLVFGLIGGADLARAYALQLAVQNGARAGAEAFAIDQAKNAQQAVQRAKDEMGRTPGMSCDLAHQCLVSINWPPGATTDGSSCTVSPPTVDDPCFVTVRVRYTFKTIIPWPIIPNTANFDRSTTMRIFY
ncbi:MAG: pilus assembly protein [Chloroflexi bacterium]|nr:MAG: pilus assembly protein [Chloroflexota bacterium]